MPLLRINATTDGFSLHDSPLNPKHPMAHLAKGHGPVIIMIHGLKYQPSHPNHCPHKRLFDGAKATSWPNRLRRAASSTHDSLRIAFGWSARGGLRHMHARATVTATALAQLITSLKNAAPRRPIHVITHSLGSQVALSALPLLQPGDVTRMILLTGASHQSHVQAMMECPAGRTVGVINVTTRENDLFDLAFEHLVPGDGAIGRGIMGDNTLNLQLDCADSLSALSDLGFPIAPPQRKISHWSAYTRAGTMAFYAGALHDPNRLTIARLQSALPHTCAPHFTRLWPTAVTPASFPLVHRMKRLIMGAFTDQGPNNEHAY